MLCNFFIIKAFLFWEKLQTFHKRNLPTWPSYYWNENNSISNVAYFQPETMFFNGKKLAMTAISRRYQNFFQSPSSELCGSARFVMCFFFYFGERFRQVTVSGDLLLSVQNESRSTIKCAQYLIQGFTILGQDLHKTYRVMAKTCARPVKSWPRLAQDL